MDHDLLAGLFAVNDHGVMIDLGFPDVRLSCHLDSYLCGYTTSASLNEGERDFIQRFRSSGGRRPIVDLIGDDALLDLRRLDGLVPPGSLIHAGVPARDVNTARNLLDWAQTGPVAVLGDLSFIVRCQQRLGTSALATLTIQVARAGVPAIVHYLLPPSLLDRTTDRVVAAMQQHLALAANDTYYDSIRGVEDTTRVLQFSDPREAPADDAGLKWNAAALIHDGGQPSEGSAGQSWLWIGAERHLRVLLGLLPHKPVSVSVRVTQVASPANLSGAQLIYNGHPLPTRCEPSGGVSGTLTARFAPEAGNLNVLGIAMPEAAQLAGQGPVMAGCIDSVEIM